MGAYMRPNLIKRIQAAEQFLDVHRPLFREIVTTLRTLHWWLTMTVAITIITLLIVSGGIIVHAVVEYNDLAKPTFISSYPPTIPQCDEPLWERMRHQCHKPVTRRVR